MKKCIKCKKEKNKADFNKNPYNKDRLHSYCKECLRDTQKEFFKKHNFKNQGEYVRYKAEKDIIKYIFDTLIISSKRRNIKVNFCLSEFRKWYNKQEKQCYYCNLQEKDIKKNIKLMPRKNVKRLTLDRLDCKKEYELTNLVLSCLRCNQIKSNFFTEREMKEIGQFYVKKKWKNYHIKNDY